MTFPSPPNKIPNSEAPWKFNFSSPRFPQELQLLVIKHTLQQENRYLPIRLYNGWNANIVAEDTIQNRRRIFPTGPSSPLLLVNSMFRAEAKRILQPIQTPVEGEEHKDVLMNPETDTVYLERCWVEFRHFLERAPEAISPGRAIHNLAVPWRRFAFMLNGSRLLVYMSKLHFIGTRKITLIVNDEGYDPARPWTDFIESEPEENLSDKLLTRMHWHTLVYPLEEPIPESWAAMGKLIEKKVNIRREESLVLWETPEFVFREIREHKVRKINDPYRCGKSNCSGGFLE